MLLALFHQLQGVLTSEEIAGLCAALVALAVPINTALLILLNRRQKTGNHHTETIRTLAHALSGEGAEPIPPEELGERVAEAAEELSPLPTQQSGPAQI